jgi:hypothetical protein
MEIHERRNKAEWEKKISKFFEPITVILVLIVFAFPVITVLNISPLTKTNSDVLGAATGKLIKIDLYTDKEANSVMSKPYLDNITESSFVISSVIDPLTEGQHEFKEFKIRNISDGQVKLVIGGTLESNTQSDFGFIGDAGKQLLQTEDGTLYNKEFILPSGESKEFKLFIKTNHDTNFIDKLSINISAMEYGQ